ncbi:MAG: nickel-dependent hydrogenase large subunit [Halieaceae bacterium]|jgi:coenzyme F420-reducing hydrogenase alpha subunit|nr:nickel-dependent hydrogenase large subunit [Halieaceae bacterium]
MSDHASRDGGVRTRTIEVDYLARVEGEGALDVRIVEGRVEELKLRIFEPPRYFEGILRGRRFSEAPDITARICGICPVAYQMSACHAMERACGVDVDGPLRELRRLLYCGEWIQSHTLHIYMLHAPDFLGTADAIEIAREHPEIVQRGLKLRGVGNRIIATLGGRQVAPVNVRVGGFYRLPEDRELEALVAPLREARDAAVETVRWTARFPFPHLEHDYEFVALRDGERYPMNEGRLVSSTGLDIDQADFEDHFEERHVAHSTALHAYRRGGGSYFTGPMARYALNAERLSPLAREMAREAGLGPVCRNPYRSIVVRAVEVVEACDEALRILENYRRPPAAAIDVIPRAAVGRAITEAPRGILYHGYTIDAGGAITEARIVPPTSQNQVTIEEDLRRVVEANAGLSDEDLGWRCEQTIRNYDPCISCATHFLRLKVERG